MNSNCEHKVEVDYELGELKNKCHQLFDAKWKSAKPSRKRRMRDISYEWLSKKMQLPRKEAHISLFTKEQCEKLIKILKDEK